MLCHVSALQVFRAKFRVNARDLKEAYVSVDGIPHDILLKGPAGQNRAMEGDVVAVELSSPANWLMLRRQEDKAQAYVSAGDGGKRAMLQPDVLRLTLMHQCIVVVMQASSPVLCVAVSTTCHVPADSSSLGSGEDSLSPKKDNNFNFDAVTAMLQKVSAR
jgi:hypothetical protein